MTHVDSASTVDKAIQLLLTLSQQESEMGTSELGRKLDIHKATVSRILLKLAEYGLVYKSKETGKYWLGPAIHQLAMTMADVNFKEVMEFARPLIDQLRDDVGETVAVEMWHGNSTVPAYCALSHHPLKVVPPPGEPLALHAAAGAKAILSFTHSDRVDMLLGGELTRITDNTIVDKNVFRQKLGEYHKQGYALDCEEFHVGICAVAAPIFDRLRQPVAALVVLAPASRFSQVFNPQLIAKLKKKTALIGSKLSVKHH